MCHVLYGLYTSDESLWVEFFVGNIGFNRCGANFCCYHKQLADCFLIIAVYVDDILIASSSMRLNIFSDELSRKFDMDLGEAKQILGMRIVKGSATGTMIMNRQKYLEKILAKFSGANLRKTELPLEATFKLFKEQSPKTENERAQMKDIPYASAVGSLMYVMICTRPGIAHAVGDVSRYMSNPAKENSPEVLGWLKQTGGVNSGGRSHTEGGGTETLKLFQGGITLWGLNLIKKCHWRKSRPKR